MTSRSDDLDHDHARVIEVIVTTLTRRGTGKDASSPVRVITQYWSLEGKLLAEVDPCTDSAQPTGPRFPNPRGYAYLQWVSRLNSPIFVPADQDPNDPATLVEGGPWRLEGLKTRARQDHRTEWRVWKDVKGNLAEFPPQFDPNAGPLDCSGGPWKLA